MLVTELMHSANVEGGGRSFSAEVARNGHVASKSFPRTHTCPFSTHESGLVLGYCAASYNGQNLQHNDGERFVNI